MTFGFYINYGKSLHREHRGNDFGFAEGEQGSAIFSATNGIVVEKGSELDPKIGRGHYVIIRDENGIKYTYMHMLEPAYVKVGTEVKVGQLIGGVGSTGASTGNHLHFQAEVSFSGGTAYLNTNTSRNKICKHGGVVINQDAYIIPYATGKRDHDTDEDFNASVKPVDVGYALQYVSVGAGTISNTLQATLKVPKNNKAGTSFIVRGLVSSSSKIKTVTLSVETNAGTKVAGYDTTLTVNAYLFDLKKFDNYAFGQLATGSYRYHLVASDEAGYVIDQYWNFTVDTSASTENLCTAEGKK